MFKPLARRSLVFALLLSVQAVASDLCVTQDGGRTQLSLCGGEPFHSTENEVTDARLVDVPGSMVLLILWNERPAGGAIVVYYGISPDRVQVAGVRKTSYDLRLKYARFDPVKEEVTVDPRLSAEASNRLYIVQFVTHPLGIFRRAITNLGGRIRGFLANHAHVVEMPEDVKAQVEALPYVRFVGPLHPAYRLEGFLRDNLDRASELFPLQRYNIMVFNRGVGQKTVVADRIRAMGGTIHKMSPNGFLLDATLTPEQLLTVVHWNEVAFVDRWHPVEFDMDIVREVGGADYVETVAGYTGQGVRGEVADAMIDIEHPDWSPTREPTIHGPDPIDPTGRYMYHGLATYGILFGDGSSDDPERKTRGMLPDAQGIFADTDDYLLTIDRDTHTCELVASDCLAECGSSDPNCPYNAVFQSNSWGTATKAGEDPYSYTTESAELDDILFRRDILVLHSMGNSGIRASREQGWAKNVVTVSGVDHLNTPAFQDDDRDLGVNYGPAYDGRVKPDLVHFSDSTIFTSGECPECTQGNFGGTSAATPITAGHFGLFFQMWHEGLFTVCDDGGCAPSGGGATVFDSRPHMTTAKAIMINTARAYCFEGQAECEPLPYHPNLTRDRQGWGVVNLDNLYGLRNSFLVIVDETKLLTLNPPGSPWFAVYAVEVPANALALKATLVYGDPPAAPGSAVTRVNELSLQARPPSEPEDYWGNNGLETSNWSSPGGHPNEVDTVENIFVQTPEEGTWTIFVFASEIQQDGHLETPATEECDTPECDVDFALVVSVVADCNANGFPDHEDIAGGFSEDCNDNGIPDECEAFVTGLEVFYAGRFGTCVGGNRDGLDCSTDGNCVGTDPTPDGICGFPEQPDPSRSFLATGATATIDNITNYIRGITGIRVFFNDVVSFATTPDAAFLFEWSERPECVGGTNHGLSCNPDNPEDECILGGGICDVNIFTPVTDAGSTITVSSSEQGGVTVVDIVLADNHVRARWLKVTIDSTQVTADGVELDGEMSGNPVVLPSGDGTAGGDAVFYLGNMPGDVDGNRKTELTDPFLIRNCTCFNPFLFFPITEAYDVDKDVKVRLSDVSGARAVVNPFFKLPLITP